MSFRVSQPKYITAATVSKLIGDNVNIPGYYLVNGVPINNQFYPALSESTAVNAVSTWQLRSHVSNKEFRSCCWSAKLGLFVAVSAAGTGDRVLTSSDGITWTTRASAADYFWRSVCWSDEQNIFVAVASSGVGNRVMTSPDGISWTLQTTPADYEWISVIWAKELNLFVAVSQTGSGNRVMTSTNGVTWTLQITPADNRWRGVCWSPELSLLVAVAESGSGNRIMTSPNGITWSRQLSPADIDYQSICWSPELALFVAVAGTGTTGRVITSTNGINWTLRTSVLSYWNSVVWSPQYRVFVAVAQSGTRIMYSSNGINWTGVTSSISPCNNICWSPELSIFVTVCELNLSSTQLIATSSLGGRIPTSFNVFDSSFNNINQLGLWNFQSFGRGRPVLKTGNFTVAPGENWIDVSNNTTTIVTLPSASLWPGEELMFKILTAQPVISNTSNNVILLNGVDASNGIVPGTTGVSTVAGRWSTLVSNGSTWEVMQAS